MLYMKAFLINLKEKAKKVLSSNTSIGAVIASLVFTSVLILQDAKHNTEILQMRHDVEAVLHGQDNYYQHKLTILEDQVEDYEGILMSREQMLQQASELIIKYRQIIEQLSRELQKHQKPQSNRSEA